MDKKYIITKLQESVPEEEKSKRFYVIDGTTYSFGEIVSEIETETQFGLKLKKAIEKVLSR